ncbi:MAG: amidohydrolase family protein [Dehalococcoidia bacterium]
MIVDFRCRPAPLATLERSRIEHFQKVFDFRLTRSYREGSVELLLEEMDEAGVDKGVIIGRQNTKAGHLNNSNDDIARMVAQYPERFVGIGGIDTSDPQEAIREMESCVGELGMRGE